MKGRILLSLLLSAGMGLPAFAKPAQMKTGRMTSIPYGHYAYCKSGGQGCGRQQEHPPIALTKSRMAAMRAVSAKINRAIRPRTDLDVYGKEDVWTFNATSGDCEDYVLSKRSRLMASGFRASDLRIAMVRQRSGEAHAVLVVRTDKGDFVLDNLRDEVLPWNLTGYRFIKMQSGDHGAKWVEIRGG